MSDPSDLFPGFKVPPNDPSREIRPAFTVTQAPLEEPRDYDESGYDEPEPCNICDGWGYNICHCGGDLCVCSFNGEIPCPNCF